VAEREDEDTAVESSLEELLQKKAADRPTDDEPEDDILELALEREDPAAVDTLEVKALPKQENEFTCSRCFLVKHQSQLADRKKKVCRDCA
jgi:hypothetical protein